MRMAMLQRGLATAAHASWRQVLCSLEELRARTGGAIKFPLSAAASALTGASATRGVKANRGGRTGFVFYCEATDKPRAFLNSCPHAQLELDFDDSDFFCDGFILCKAHGAYFDPETGVCLKGPAATRRRRPQQQIGALTELPIVVEDGCVILVAQESPAPTTEAKTDADWHAHRAIQQQKLGAVLATQHEDVQRIQDEVQAKAVARMQRYAAEREAQKPPKQ